MRQNPVTTQKPIAKDKQKKVVGKYIVYPKDILGEGTFGTACLSRLKSDNNHQLACKIINKNKIQTIIHDIGYLMNRVRDEVNAWKQLIHPNIVKFQGSEQTKNNIYFFSQLCSTGTLQQYISNHRFNISIQEVTQFCKQIISACTYLEAKGIVHRDIKPANILLKDNHVKIGDFGLARIIKHEDSAQIANSFFTFAGTLHFMAPQILMHKKYSSKCDVWSVGVTIFLMFTSELPFGLKIKDHSQSVLLQKIMNHDEQFKYQIFEENKHIKNMLKLMLVVEQQKRVKMSQVEKLINEA